jgi:hypothetical protein
VVIRNKKGESKMKALSYILVLLLFVLGSCTSSLYTGGEYDDLYYTASDKPVVKAKSSVNDRVADGTLKSDEYYDNIYAADTLVLDDYADAIDFNNSIDNNNNYGGGYDYYNNSSYAGRMRRFNGNYFDPYWRDPFYFDYGYSPFGYNYGFGGYPYNYSPYYGYGGMYGDYYGYGGGYYGGGYYGGGYYGLGFGGGYWGLGSGWGSFYGGGPYGGYGYYSDAKNSVPYGRRERPSTFSSKWNTGSAALGASGRDLNPAGGSSVVARRTPSGISGTQSLGTGNRRTASGFANSQQALNPSDRKPGQDQSKGASLSNITTPRNSANVRPEYNNSGRTYTPSYNNPRMSTRPSYNNSRVSDVTNQGFNRSSSTTNNSRTNSNVGSVRIPSNQGATQNQYNNSRSNSSGSSVERRSVTPSNSVQYSVPSRRSSESSSGYSSGSYNNSSSGSRSSSSYSSGSSGSESRSSYSSGSSSGSSSSSSSGSSSGSSSHRR